MAACVGWNWPIAASFLLADSGLPRCVDPPPLLHLSLLLPGQLPIKPYTGTTVYTVDESSGKITGHTETWDISALDAFVSTLVPGFGAPPAPPVAQ